MLLIESRAAFGRRPVELRPREPGAAPGGRLNVPPPKPPAEDDIDREVRRDLDAWAKAGDVRFTGSRAWMRWPSRNASAVPARREPAWFYVKPAGF
ncbi:MAG TPA: hypothetical protein VG268_15095 [Streptosporangiaceae bacterium]|nr:hypothetical protein [Streptosporangiaceae bacterium]